jgi:dynein heavy chain
MQRMATGLCQKLEQAKLPKPAAVANKMKVELMDFKQWIPIIDALCNQGLKTRHINEITKIVGINVSEKDTKLDTLRQMQIDKHKDLLEEISDKATKEWNNEKIMASMKEAWEPLKFTCKEVEGKSSKILQGDAIEEIQTILDDHIIKTQTMKGSPFAKFMLKEIVAWEDMLMNT